MSLEKLSKRVLAFKKSERYDEVKKRLREFDFERKGHHEWFSELCFCLLTANASAEAGIRVQKDLPFLYLSDQPCFFPPKSQSGENVPG